MYNLNSILITTILFVSLVIAIQAGYRIGRRSQASVDEISKSHVNEFKPLVEENLWGDWKIRKESHTHRKKDASTIEFEIPVPKDGEAVVEYTVLLRW